MQIKSFAANSHSWFTQLYEWRASTKTNMSVQLFIALTITREYSGIPHDRRSSRRAIIIIREIKTHQVDMTVLVQSRSFKWCCRGIEQDIVAATSGLLKSS